MTVLEIQKILLSKFFSHKYQLCNSYVFNWECDFFSMASSGFAYEVEIKMSRSDFFADFKKQKHILFQKQIQGKTFYWENRGKSYRGETIGRIQYKTLEFGYPEKIMGKVLDAGVIYDWKEKMYLSNQWEKYYLENKTLHMRAPATDIYYVDLNEIHFPNRFYYCCPKDLIKKEEVPKYAGLYYIDGHEIKTIKQAPVLTKRLMQLTSVLLEKFYYECIKLRSQIRMQNET